MQLVSSLDQHEYTVLIEHLHGLHWISPLLSAQALVQARDALVLKVEVRVAALVVTDIEGWATASLLNTETTVPFINSRLQGLHRGPC
jgi:hypothetical protein